MLLWFAHWHVWVLLSTTSTNPLTLTGELLQRGGGQYKVRCAPAPTHGPRQGSQQQSQGYTQSQTQNYSRNYAGAGIWMQSSVENKCKLQGRSLWFYLAGSDVRQIVMLLTTQNSEAAPWQYNPLQLVMLALLLQPSVSRGKLADQYCDHALNLTARALATFTFLSLFSWIWASWASRSAYCFQVCGGFCSSTIIDQSWLTVHQQC